MKITRNYHTHTYRCKHATDDVTDYCRAALAQGLEVLGISDHTALPDDRWPHIRMPVAELPNYIAAIDAAIDAFPELKILKGAECEYAPEYHSFFEDTLLGQHRFAYLIGAAHYFPLDGEWVGSYGGADTPKGLRAYADYFIESMESKLFAFMAHPDLFGNCYHRWDANAISASKDILSAAESLQIPLEINGYGLRKPKIATEDGLRCMYPWLPFWELASDYKITVIANSDAHQPGDVSRNIAEATAIGRDLGLSFADLGYLEQSSQ
jgi:histidinol-phosphatase (PHP family)